MKKIYLACLLLFGLSAYSQKTITGTVSNTSTGEPISFVSVLSQSGNATITNEEGNYSILVSGPNDSLEFSSNGFESLEVSVGERSIIDVALEVSTTNLDEVSLNNAATPIDVYQFESHKHINSLYGSAKMGYKDFLFLEVTGRNDWSSALATPFSVDGTSFFLPFRIRELSFKGRLNFDLTYYNSLTKDQIISLPVAVSSGYNFQMVNEGSVRSQGFEAVVGITPFDTPDFRWTSLFNFSTNKSIVENLPRTDSRS